MSKCRVCDTDTNVVVNIQFKAVPVCEDCCRTIMVQTIHDWSQQMEQVSRLIKAAKPFLSGNIVDETSVTISLMAELEAAMVKVTKSDLKNPNGFGVKLNPITEGEEE